MEGQLQRDRDAAAVVVVGSVAPQDPAAPSANRREGTASLQKGGFAARLSEIAQAHPEAERFEIWSQDATQRHRSTMRQRTTPSTTGSGPAPPPSALPSGPPSTLVSAPAPLGC